MASNQTSGIQGTGATCSEEKSEAFRDVKSFDAWLRQNAGSECGYVETAPAYVATGLRGAKYAHPAEQKVLFRLADGRLVYWQLDPNGDSRNPGRAVFVTATDTRVAVQS